MDAWQSGRQAAIKTALTVFFGIGDPGKIGISKEPRNPPEGDSSFQSFL